jgi:hypothetical protein
MSQQNQTASFAVALASDISPAPLPDDVAIFSAPDVVFHWWSESKRRWAEQNQTMPPLVLPARTEGDV